MKSQSVILACLSSVAYTSPVLFTSTRADIQQSAFNATAVLLDTVNAIGGIEALRSLANFTYQSSNIYRSQTLTQNYNLDHSDQSVAEAGAQNISFSISPAGLKGRIDRRYRYNDYWIWAHADLEPSVDYTIVIQDGQNGSACFTKGSNNFFADNPGQASGFTDSLLTDYLIHQAHQYALPWLLNQFLFDADQLVPSMILDPITNTSIQAIEHPSLDLSLCVNEMTKLPYMVRSIEEHAIFGHSTNDLLFNDYSVAIFEDRNDTALFLPHRFQTVYNSINVLEDFVIDSITLNPTFPNGYFDPLPKSESEEPSSAPAQSAEYPRSEVHEFFETGLWQGPLDPGFFNTSTVIAEYPVAGFDQVQSVYIAYADYVQLVVEFEQGVLVTDAPAHRSNIIIDWVQQTMQKNVTHVVPSHHHHDHAGGVGDYVARGATLVVPEIAKKYYEKVNGGNVKFATYTEEQPFILRDNEVEFRALWRNENPHAKDWSYGVVSKACPSTNDSAVAFIADVVSPSEDPKHDGFKWDVGYARQWLNAAVQDKLPRSSTVVCAHGGDNTTVSLGHVLEVTGFAYPALTIEDWINRLPSCAN